MKKVIVVVAVAPLLLTLMVGSAVAETASAIIGSLATGGSAGSGSAPPALPTGPGVGAVPPAMVRLYAAAAATCPGLSWAVLAAIGTVESANGTSSAPGVHSGANPAGAEGPMQFEPATFAAYDEPVPPGGVVPPSPYDPNDAVYAAARMLCANGAAHATQVAEAVYAYNHSEAYVSQVLDIAAGYGFGTAIVTTAGTEAVNYALAQLGTPYQWGGESATTGFDCSGLAQAAWAEAGVALPRVAQAQFDAGPALAPGSELEPGDLVFFGRSTSDVTHVGIVVQPFGVMVDAPHTGAEVRVEPFPIQPGERWGGERYLGATDPAGVEVP
jgi:cell wall-associated NlpC family hydrolase